MAGEVPGLLSDELTSDSNKGPPRLDASLPSRATAKTIGAEGPTTSTTIWILRGPWQSTPCRAGTRARCKQCLRT